MTIVPTFGLLASLFAPIHGEGVTSPEATIGIEFGESIPEHDRTPLQASFETTVPLACGPVPPCVQDCSGEDSTLGLDLDGSNRNYSLHWVANDPRLGQPVILDSECELCSLVELEQLFASDLERVCRRLETELDNLEAAPGQLVVSSDPARARLRVDGAVVGRTPWSGELNAGAHTIELRASGRRPQRHTVTIAGNVEARRHFSLVSSFAKRGRPTWPGYASLGVGIAMAVAGTALISVHGQPWTRRCSGPDIDIEGNCRYVLTSRPLGIGLAAIGAGAIASGIGLLVWAQRDPSQTSTSAGIMVSGRF